MKKKNVLTMAMSLALVGVIAVGGTMAYLTASDDAVVNKFEFATGGSDGSVIGVQLDETAPVTGLGNATATSNEFGGVTYTNVVPGQQLPKAPTVTVTTDVDAYVFVKITQGTNVTVDEINEDWTEYGEDTGIYYQVVSASVDTQQPLGAIFDNVTVADMDSVEGVTLDDIKIQVAAVAKGSLTLEQAKTEADGAYKDYLPVVGG